MGNRHHVNTSPKALIVALAAAMTVSQMPAAAIAEVVVDAEAAQETPVQTVASEPGYVPEGVGTSEEVPEGTPEAPAEGNTEDGGEAEEASVAPVPKNTPATHAFAFTGAATIKNGSIVLGSLPFGMIIQANGVTFDNVAITRPP